MNRPGIKVLQSKTLDAPKGAGLGKAQSASEQNYPGVAAGLDGLFIPDTGLHLADVG
ncbi:hypothetical protein M5E87_02645 [Flavonifractor plautii]|nr:hypothetical protein M5E87_02645 [Flavonifractor plautii]